ncbi:MAG: hypothetical protein D6704_01650 [Nitrospirae bacterium]|nr:MAG: hypothetical protein D6704_01650 [Nitrospirota bacterium]
MSAHELKWKMNQEKVAVAKAFPGLNKSWTDTVGKCIQTIVPLQRTPGGAVLLFTDGTFAVAHPLFLEPRLLTDAISVARPFLEPLYPEAYARYDICVHQDQEATKQARLENILGAIHNNLEWIPELKERLRALVKEWGP